MYYYNSLYKDNMIMFTLAGISQHIVRLVSISQRSCDLAKKKKKNPKINPRSWSQTHDDNTSE